MKKFFTLVAATLATSAFAAIDSAPASADVQTWYFNGQVVYPEETIINQEIQVAIDGNDLYFTGLKSEISSWVKGTSTDGVNYTFVNQDQGMLWGSYAMSFTGVVDWNYLDATATLVDGVLTFQTGLGYLYTDYPDSPWIWWQPGATMSAEPLEYQEPILNENTASVPYRNNFDTEAKRNQVAIYPYDYTGWDWGADWSTNNWYAACNNDGWQNADDYLIFPGLPLEAGKSYVVRFDAQSSSSNAWQYFSVVMGNEAKLSKLVDDVMPTTFCYSTDWQNFEQEFSVEETGTYYLAIHSTSYAYSGYLSVDNFVVEEMDMDKPEVAQDLTVSPGRNGALSATLNFTMPSANIGGQAYASDKVLSYTVTRGEFIVAEGQEAAGALVFVTDNNVLTNGYATYKVVISDENHVSKEVSASAYIGLDYPTETEYMEITVEGNQVTIAWVPVTRGANGGYVGAKYNVYACSARYQLGEKLNDEPLTECVYTFEYDVESGEQGAAWFAVTAVNDLDESYGNFASIPVGSPYELPYEDSFAADDTHVWSFAGDGGDAYVDRWGSFSTDGDDAALYFYVWSWDTESSYAAATTGKILTAANALLSFDYKAEGNVKLAVSAIAGDKVATVGETLEIEAGEGTIELENIFADVLDNSYANLCFTVTCEQFYQGLYIDNLKIEVIDVPTGISELNAEGAAKVYSLDGKLLNARPAAGFYIQNGQKMLVK